MILLALYELDRPCSSTDIVNLLVDHRIRISNSSLAQTLKKAQMFKLITKNDGYLLTPEGKIWASNIKKIFEFIANL